MIARTIALLGLAVVAMPSRAATVTVAVAGVTVNAEQTRIEGIRVKMIGGGNLASDTTWRGVYNLSEGGVDESTERLLVVCEESNYDADAREVVLGSIVGGIKRGKAEDITLFSRNQPIATVEHAGERLANADRTIALKLKWNLIAPDAAESEYQKKAGEIAAAVPDAKWQDVLTAAQLAQKSDPAAGAPSMCNGEWGSSLMKSLPQLELFKSEQQNTKDRIQRTETDLRDTIGGIKPIDKQAIDKLLTVPSTEIPSEWLTNPKVRDDLSGIVGKYVDEKRSPPVDPGAISDPDKLRDQLDKNPRAKQLLLYEHLLRTPGVSEERKQDLRSRVKQLRPGLGARPTR